MLAFAGQLVWGCLCNTPHCKDPLKLPRAGLGWVLAVGCIGEGSDVLCSLTGKQIIGSMPAEPTQHYQSLSHHTDSVIDVQLLGSM